MSENLPQLTNKQWEIVKLIQLPDKLIADKLGISEHTVARRLDYIYKKMGVHGRLELLLKLYDLKEKAHGMD